MLKQRSIRWLVAGMAAGLILTACGDVADPQETEAEPAAEEEEGDEVTLTLESWRDEDVSQWEEIIDVFESDHPGIRIDYDATHHQDYDAAMRTRLEGGAAGDLLACRAFDGSLQLAEEGYLEPIDDLPGLDNFSDEVLQVWQDDDQTTTHCVPMGGSIHGFIYNTEVFEELGLTPPQTHEEMIALLEEISDDGTYTPLAIGTSDPWSVGEMGYSNIGPNYWRGEEGRQGLIEGTAKFTDEEFVEAFRALADWTPFLPDGHEAVTYPDAQQLFTTGRAAIYPSGSWEIVGFNEQVEFEMGFFKAPLPDASQGVCYTNFHTDIGMGMNAATDHPEEARTFLEWVATTEFANVYGNAVVGQVPLTSEPVDLEDPLLEEFLTATTECENTIRPAYQILDRGEPNTTTVLFDVSTNVLAGSMEPEDAAEELQSALESWYEPQQQ